MQYNIVVAGVGGQGVLSLSAIIAAAALRERLQVKQAEVHGMSQRGGAVVADLRLADGPIHADIIPRGSADLILSMEPLESLRYLPRLKPQGSVVTSTNPHRNIADYPDEGALLQALGALPHVSLLDAEALARQAGSQKASNMVMVGAASALLPLKVLTLEALIAERFAAKGPKVVATNLEAFGAGRAAVSP